MELSGWRHEVNWTW